MILHCGSIPRLEIFYGCWLVFVEYIFVKLYLQQQRFLFGKAIIHRYKQFFLYLFERFLQFDMEFVVHLSEPQYCLVSILLLLFKVLMDRFSGVVCPFDLSFRLSGHLINISRYLPITLLNRRHSMQFVIIRTIDTVRT